MAWFADLEPCTYFRVQADKLIAVGWLEAGHPFARGPLDRAVADRFAEMIWNQGNAFPRSFFGGHDCTLCDSTDPRQPNSDSSRSIASYGAGTWGMVYNGVQTQVGVNNIFVPADGHVYVAPTLMLHYMVDHGYAPPPEFCEALLGCPPIGSEAYYEAFERSGPEEWKDWARRRGQHDESRQIPVTEEREEDRVYTGVVVLERVTHQPSAEHTAAHIAASVLASHIARIEALASAAFDRVAESQRFEVEIDIRPESRPLVRLALPIRGNVPAYLELARQLNGLPPIYANREPVGLRLEFSVTASGRAQHASP